MLGDDSGCDRVEDIEDIVKLGDEIIKHTSVKELIHPHVRRQTKDSEQRNEEIVQADSIIPGRQHNNGGCTYCLPLLDDSIINHFVSFGALRNFNPCYYC